MEKKKKFAKVELDEHLRTACTDCLCDDFQKWWRKSGSRKVHFYLFNKLSFRESFICRSRDCNVQKRKVSPPSSTLMTIKFWGLVDDGDALDVDSDTEEIKAIK